MHAQKLFSSAVLIFIFEAMENSYEIKLPQFEGPFDLLLFFIERDELDVYDIPIAKITSDFLDYIHHMTVMNIELASEFIVVAATLMRIKAKMLLPRKDLDEKGAEIDPRKELVDQLLEYKRYKEASEQFKQLEDERSKQFERGNTDAEMKSLSDSIGGEAELHTLTLFKLMKSFEKVMARFEEIKNRPVHTVVQYAYTIAGQRNYLRDMVKRDKTVAFEKIFEPCENRIHAIFTFLALLEMVQLQFLALNIGLGINNFWIGEGKSIDAELPSSDASLF